MEGNNHFTLTTAQQTNYITFLGQVNVLYQNIILTNTERLHQRIREGCFAAKTQDLNLERLLQSRRDCNTLYQGRETSLITWKQYLIYLSNHFFCHREKQWRKQYSVVWPKHWPFNFSPRLNQFFGLSFDYCSKVCHWQKISVLYPSQWENRHLQINKMLTDIIVLIEINAINLNAWQPHSFVE